MHDCNDSDASGDEDAIPSGMNASTTIEHSNQSVCALEDGNAQSLGEILPHVAKELSEVAKQLETADNHDAVAMTSSSHDAIPLSAAGSAQPPEGTPLGYTPQRGTHSELIERPTLVWNTGTSIGAQPEGALDEPPDRRPGSKPRVTSPVRHFNLDSALPLPPSLAPAILEPDGLRDTAKAGADQISQFIKSAQSRGMTGGVIRAAGDTIMQWEHGLNAAKLLKERRKSLAGLVKYVLGLVQSWWTWGRKTLGSDRMLMILLVLVWQREAIRPVLRAIASGARDGSLQALDCMTSGAMGNAVRKTSEIAGKVLASLGASLVVSSTLGVPKAALGQGTTDPPSGGGGGGALLTQ
jgi:hypothetical protein